MNVSHCLSSVAQVMIAHSSQLMQYLIHYRFAPYHGHRVHSSCSTLSTIASPHTMDTGSTAHAVPYPLSLHPIPWTPGPQLMQYLIHYRFAPYHGHRVHSSCSTLSTITSPHTMDTGSTAHAVPYPLPLRPIPWTPGPQLMPYHIHYRFAPYHGHRVHSSCSTLSTITSP